MKKLATLLVTFFVSFILIAQTPQAFKYQAVVRNDLGDVINNHTVSFRISIHDSIATGPIQYQETHVVMTDAYGLANLEIGSGTLPTGTLADVDWADDHKFMEVEFDPDGNTAYVSMGTTQLLAVPYALYSETSGDAGAAEIDDLTDGRTIGLSVFLGSGTGSSDDGSTNRNTAIGYDALHLSTFGFNNTAIGYNALYSNTSGRDNVASGHSALYSNTTGGFNVGFGMSANRLNQTGSQNTIIGYEAGRGTSLHNKSGNVFIGYRAGYNETGSNKLYIQNDSSSTPLIGGDFSVDEIYLNGKVGIGTSNPEYNLTVSDDIYSHSSFIGVSKTNYTDTWNNLDGSIAMPLGFIGTQGSWRSSWVWNGYRNSSNTWTSLGLNGYTSAYAIELGYDGIYFRTASEVLTGNSPPIRMFINDIGNVGIGTSAPTGRLHTSIDNFGRHLKCERTGLNPSYYEIYLAGDIIYHRSDVDQVIQIDSMDIMTIVASGNVGIGTTSPTEMLEVADTIYSSVGGFKFPDGSVQEIAAGTGGLISIDNLTDGKISGNSVFLGPYAGENDDGGNYNTAVGKDALNSNTSGSFNTAIGYSALTANLEGERNTANGYTALGGGEGSDNTAIGFQALIYSEGDCNTASGSYALSSNGYGEHNTATGYRALSSNLTGFCNTANGSYALYQTTTSHNTAIGYSALYSNTDGNHNTANGSAALYSNTTGSRNTANGYYALMANTTGWGNTAKGYYALSSNTTGNDNVGLGYQSNLLNQEGSQNTIVGYQAGYGTGLHNKSGNIFLGYQAGYNEIGDNKLYIENSDTIAPLIYGEFDNDILAVNGDLGIGIIDPTANLHVDGTDGVLFSGTHGSGSMASTGPGTRMMWYPAKAAFRAGHVIGTQWNDVNIGDYSSALGRSTIAYGLVSTAMGYLTTASGDYSTAMGHATEASGYVSTALGYYTEASGLYSTAMGRSTIASGDYSTAMGSYVGTFGEGGFFIGDHSTTTVQSSTIDNSFNARFAGGYYLNTVATAPWIGAWLGSGLSSWGSISDSTKKENFQPVNGENVLSKISEFKLGTWNYKGQDATTFRHYGPMAQDFYAAFGNDGIGAIGNDTILSSSDFDGINFIAIQALEKRTSELKELKRELEALKEENQRIEQQLANLTIDIQLIKSLAQVNTLNE